MGEPVVFADHINKITNALQGTGWFIKPGAYALVDGQFGSTGKGALAILLALAGRDRISIVTTNAGPNSGHTGYMPEASPWRGQKILTQQIPVASMVLSFLDPHRAKCYLNGGAIIDEKTLMAEATRFNTKDLYIHPCAALIEPQDVQAEATGGPSKIASTGKGVGSALARKTMREGNVIGSRSDRFSFFANIRSIDWDWSRDIVLVETAQGFSLGINEARFYPHTTSRECTVAQAIADARIPPQKVKKVALSLRTFPIRVGNTDLGHSGGVYSDQQETSWAKIGVPAELTTVTKRVRRVFTWSRIQFMEAVAANRPDVLFLNFMNYLHMEDSPDFLQQVKADYVNVIGHPPELVLLGYGSKPEDVSIGFQS